MLSNGSASERTDRKGSPAVPSICVIQILQLVKGSETSSFLLADFFGTLQ